MARYARALTVSGRGDRTWSLGSRDGVTAEGACACICVRVRVTAQYADRMCAEKRSRGEPFPHMLFRVRPQDAVFDAGGAENFPKMLVGKEFFSNFTVD